MKNTIMVMTQNHDGIYNASNLRVENDGEFDITYITADVEVNRSSYRITLGVYPTEDDAVFVLEELVAFANKNPLGIFDMQQLVLSQFTPAC